MKKIALGIVIIAIGVLSYYGLKKDKSDSGKVASSDVSLDKNKVNSSDANTKPKSAKPGSATDKIANGSKRVGTEKASTGNEVASSSNKKGQVSKKYKKKVVVSRLSNAKLTKSPSSFKKLHKPKDVIDLEGGVKLLLSERYQAITKKRFSSKIGFKKGMRRGFVIYEPRKPNPKKFPVVYNTKYRKEGYFSGLITVFYKNKFDKENIINTVIHDYGNKLNSVDQELKIISFDVKNIKKIKQVLAFQENAEVDIVYAH